MTEWFVLEGTLKGHLQLYQAAQSPVSLALNGSRSPTTVTVWNTAHPSHVCPAQYKVLQMKKYSLEIPKKQTRADAFLSWRILMSCPNKGLKQDVFISC